MAEQTPDSIITTQRNGQTIVAELFFNHSSTETFRDKLLKLEVRAELRLSTIQFPLPIYHTSFPTRGPARCRG